MKRGPARLVALCAAAVLLASGCARPSSVRSAANPQTPGPSGEAVAEGPLLAGPAASPAPLSSGRSTRVTGRAKPATTPKPGAASQAAAAAVAAGAVDPGVTSDSIKIGFIVVSNNNKLQSNYGVRGGAIGDTKDQVNAVVNDVNSRGIAGRKIVPVFRELDATDQSDPYPAICQAFTQDEKVFGVLSPWNPSGGSVFTSCLAKAKTLFVNDSLLQEDADHFAEFKPYLVSGLMNSSRAGVALATGLYKAGYFKDAKKVGIVRTTNPIYQRVSDKYVKPTLAKFGIKVELDLTAGTTTVNDAVLKMKDAGVDRVMFVGAAGGNPLFFMNFAQSQGYFPRYGLASPDSPAFQAQNAPYTQLRGAMAVGWMPSTDVLSPEGPPLSAAEKRCFDVHRKGGTDYQSRNDDGTPALLFCDLLWLFEKVGNAVGANLTRAAFAQQLAGLGSSYDSPVTFSTSFSSEKFDGALSVRPLAYDDAPTCRCFKYTGAAEPLS
jgi:hypothetical protein